MDIDHWVQLLILKELLFKQKARFSELNTTDLTTDLFTFHLRHLTDKGLIEKVQETYQLTPYGLEIASRLDVRSLKMVKQAKIGVTICIMDKGNILLGERLRDPQKGKIGFHSRKVLFGESLYDTAKRCLKDETGLEGDIEYAGEVHILDKSQESDRLMTYFRVRVHSTNEKRPTPRISDRGGGHFRVKNSKGELIVESEDTKNFWVSFAEAYKLKNTFPDLAQDLDLFKSRRFFFEERII